MIYMDHINIKMPRRMVEGLNELVRLRRYPNRSEAIRAAVRDLLRFELFQQQLDTYPTIEQRQKQRTKDLLKHDPEIKDLIEDIVQEICGRG